MDANWSKEERVSPGSAYDEALGDDPEHDAFQDVEDDGPMRSALVAPPLGRMHGDGIGGGGMAEDLGAVGGLDRERALGEVGLSEVMASTSTHEAVPKRAPLEFGALEKPVYRSVPGIEQPLGELALGPPPSLHRMDMPKAPPSSGMAMSSAFSRPGATPAVGEDFKVLTLQEYYRLDKTHAALEGGRDAAGVAAEVDAALREHDVDFVFKSHKSKWKCCHASNACMVEFVVRLWLRSGPTAVLVIEFQRRSGDHAKMLQIFHGTLGRLGVKARVTSSLLGGSPGPGFGLGAVPGLARSGPMAMPAGAAPGMVPPPSSLSQGVAGEEAALAKTVRHLMDMVSGGLVDVALQGARALAQLSMDKDLVITLHQAGVVPVLIHFLEGPSNFGHVSTMARTFAVACIANMSEEPIVQGSLYAGTALLLSLVDEGTFTDRAMRREAARTLRNLAQDTHGADSIIKIVGRDELEAWCRHKFPLLVDPQMRTDVADVKLNLERRWQACN